VSTQGQYVGNSVLRIAEVMYLFIDKNNA